MTRTAKDLGEISLRLTKEKDPEGWLALFAPDATLEDPVGGPVHRGVEAIAAFHKNTISKMTAFDYRIERSYLAGSEAAMVVTFHIEIGGGRLDMDVVNIYTATRDGQLQSLRSFWDGSRQGG